MLDPRRVCKLAVAMMCGVLLSACTGNVAEVVQLDATSESASDELELSAWEANQLLARTINLGGVYEVERSETWAIPFELEDLDSIANHGFTAVRLPILWTDWAEDQAPYTLEPEILVTIDAVVERALARNLAVIVDLHYYPELNADPQAHADRFVGIWAQLADHYQDQPTTVLFELFNEPYDKLGGDALNDLLAATVGVIRETNPHRTLVVGPGEWNSPLALEHLVLPPDDNLILTVHQYEPFEFTHQGASWVQGAEAWRGTGFSVDPGSEDATALVEEFALVAQWAKTNDVPVFVGEFGAMVDADRQDRLAWTRFVREQSEEYGFSWGYWDWAGPNFGLLNQQTGEWDAELLDALTN